MLIKGSGASQGKVKGVAKVITSLDNTDKLNHGDILITIATTPAWTPFIHSAAAVVTDSGGILCHAAIVCREYGIPAVVGTKDGTRRIRNGQKVLVDGTNGTIELLES